MSGVPRGRTGSFWSEGVGDRGLRPGRKLWALSEGPSLAWGQPQVEHGDCRTLAWGCPLPGPQGSIQYPVSRKVSTFQDSGKAGTSPLPEAPDSFSKKNLIWNLNI